MSSPSLLKRPIFWLIVSPLVLAIIWLLLLPDQAVTASVDPAAYRTELLAERQKKNESLRNNADSPILDKAAFKGLTYFDPDPAFRVVAQLDPFPAGQTERLVIKLTDGTEEVYEKYAHATFTLAGKPCRVLVLKYQKTLTVLFRDATSGQETYGGGRYLDLDATAQPNLDSDKQVILDFNAAYNPYCAYNPNFACPLPPAENTLPVAVRAGERYSEEK